MNRKAALILSIFLAITVAIYFNIKQPVCSGLECITFSSSEDWKIKEVYEASDSSWKGSYTRESSLLKLEKISGVTDELAGDLTNSRMMQVQGIFDKARSPYPGQISDEIVCPDKFKPVEKKLTNESGTEITFYHLFLNDRLIAGTCTDDEVKYESYNAVFHCRQRSEWYQLDLIEEKENIKNESYYLDLFRSIGC